MLYFCKDFTYLAENVLVTGSSPTALEKELPSLAALSAALCLFSQDIFPDIQLNCRISLCSFSALFYQGKTSLPASETVAFSQHTPLVPDQENYQGTSGKPRS